MFKPIIPLLFTILIWPCFNLHAQILYSNGSTFYIATGGVVMSNGGVELTQNTVLSNEGSLTVTKNSTFPNAGNFMLNTTSASNGDGIYRVEQDWINDASFSGDNGTVELYGNSMQTITSNSGQMTTFNNLILSGIGTGNNRKKVLSNVDAAIGLTGTLSINDRELATETWNFSVLNSSAACVTNSTTPGSEGFVSSLSPGYFIRVSNTPAPYLFPTGSSLGTWRYRPVAITPQPGAQTTYNVRLNNNDATADGFNRTLLANDICNTNELFYHSITRSAGVSDADVTLSYLLAADGNWAHFAHWQSGNSRWNNLDPSLTGTLAGFSTVTKTAWTFPDTDHPYILSEVRPLPPTITACPSLCQNSVASVSASGASNGYLWTVLNGAVIQTGQGSGNISVLWNSANTGYITVVATGTNGCHSIPDTCLPEVFAAPTANFSTASQTEFGTAYQFIDESNLANEWSWDFGDGNTSTVASPEYTYTLPGTYTVTLSITSKDGCTAEGYTVIHVEGETVYVPNSFTPNDDFTNEGFHPINRSGEGVSFEIYNRWGEQIFKSDDPKYGWDGTYGGKPCPLDVYVYKVYYKDAVGASKTIIGHVNLIK